VEVPDLGYRRRGVLIGICLTALLAIVIAVQVGRSASDSSGPTAANPVNATPAPGGGLPPDPAKAIAGLLAGRATGIRDGDRTAWLAALDPSAGPAPARFRVAQGQIFDRVRTLRPVSWAYRVTGGSALPAARRAALGADAWLADVQLEYQLVSGGPQVHREQFLTMVRRGRDWRIAADTDGATGRDIWDLGPIAHASAARCLVVGAASRQVQVTQLAGECDGPARAVDVAWGTSWPRRTVLTVPATVRQLAVLLGRSGAGTGGGTGPPDAATVGLERTAAVTIGPANSAADEVLVNGAAFDELRAIGQRVVLTHELVHVATRATGSSNAPTWLEEGFADYVAYLHTGLPDDQVAGDALTGVRAGRLPAQLPDSDAFNAAGDQASAAYGQAWVAVQLIASRAGSRQRMKLFYQQAANGAGAPSAAAVDTAFARIGLTGLKAFVPLWQARLEELAR
jgi:hypothetical protein